MAGSPYRTTADVPRADVAILERAWVDHTSRHRCRRNGGCETRRVLWSDALDSVSQTLEREIAKGEAA